MSKTPARLNKMDNDDVSPLFVNNWVLLHPVVILLAIIIGIFMVSLLIFAVTGHSAVDSGGMRNFIASGV